MFRNRKDRQDPDDWEKRPSRKKRAGRGNLTKGFEDGPGGKKCSCCGVRSDYKSLLRANSKSITRAELREFLDSKESE
jgi:hypothetical protein